MFEFYIPQSLSEWLVWLVALGFVFVGLFYFFAPKAAMRLCWTYPQQESAALLGFVRGNMGGVPLGLGLSYLIFAQPMIAIALFSASLFAALGRIVSLFFDRSFSGFGLFALIGEIVFAAASFPFAFNYPL